MYKYILISCLVFTCSLFGSTAHGARALGMGGAFSSVSDDANSIFWNPAGLSYLQNNAAIAHYSSLYTGFSNDNIGNGAIGYIHRFKKLGVFAFSTDMLYSDIYTKNVISLNYSKKLKSIRFGLRANILLSNYNENNFYYTEDDIAEDPLFSEYGYNSNAFSLDFGLLYSPIKNLSTGLYLKNFIAPDLALSNIESKPPISYKLGLSYKLSPNSILSTDFEYLSEKINDQNFQYYLGAEQWFFSKTIALRSGFNSNQFSVGSSLLSSKLFNIQVDYSFIYPINKLSSKSSSTHKFTLSSNFIKPNETKTEIKPEITKPVEHAFIPPKPEITIEINPDELIIEDLIQIEEEQPLVPVIFFEIGEYEVHKRFNNLIHTLALRLKNNPDLKLNIYGYFDPLSEGPQDELATLRAKTVKGKISDLHPEIKDRVNIVYSGYDPTKQRSGDSSLEKNKYFDEICEENRRVELHAEVTGVNRMIFVDSFSPDVVINSFGSIISNNPDVDLIIESASDEASLMESFTKQRIIEQELGYPGQQRTYVSITNNDTKYIHLNADAAIYQPIKKRNALEFEGNIENTSIHINIDNPAMIKEFSVDIIDDKGINFTNIDKGKDFKNNYNWDFTDINGNFVDHNSSYYAKFSAIDTLGREISSLSKDNFKITINNSIQLQSKQLIVQFQYDNDNPQSQYLEDKLEYITRKLIDMAMAPHKTIDILITGHTDIIGSSRRNEELSKERAAAEYQNIRSYFKAILNLKSDSELNDWLQSKNITFSYIGQSSNEPYSITVNNNHIEKTIIGNNASPEGRTVNRRVEILILNEIK